MVTNIGWLGPGDEAEWDAFVTQHPLGMVYHLSVWKEVLEDAFPHIRGRFLVARDPSSGRIRAGLPVYAVKSWLLGRRLVSIPYATVCDPLISSTEDIDAFMPHIEQLQRDTGSCRVEIRVRKTGEYFAASSLPSTAMFKHHYLVLDKDPDALFRTFSRTCVRKNITRAQRLGVVIKECQDEESMKICHSLLFETRRRLTLPPMPYSFFRAMKQFLWPTHMSYFLALQDGKPLGCFVMLGMNDFWVAESSGNMDDDNAGVDQLLYWETMKWVMARGAKVYSFGRTSVTNEGLLTYKRRWATTEEDLAEVVFSLRGKRVQDPVEAGHGIHHSSAYRAARLAMGLVPRSIFQKVGDFCYRHMG